MGDEQDSVRRLRTGECVLDGTSATSALRLLRQSDHVGDDGEVAGGAAKQVEESH